MADITGMTIPRQVVPGRDYMITRRCSERRFFLRPDDDTNIAFIFCLALAAMRAKVQVTFAVAMSNHHHTGIHDPDGNFPVFTEHFHSLLALCQNAHLGRFENFWSSEPTEELASGEGCNAVGSWPGANCPDETQGVASGIRAMKEGRPRDWRRRWMALTVLALGLPNVAISFRRPRRR